MAGKILVTIGRQFGSGGREIGRLLAQRLDIPFYDKELVALAAKNSGMSPELFESNDERPVSSLLYSMSVNPYAIGHVPGVEQMPIPQKLFLAQFDTIKSLAEKGSSVFVGRCADYVLREEARCVNIFIHAPLDVRIGRVRERLGISAEDAKALVAKTDKKRSAYYNSFSDRKWGGTENYHLSFDSSRVTHEKAAALIASYLGME